MYDRYFISYEQFNFNKKNIKYNNMITVDIILFLTSEPIRIVIHTTFVCL